MNDNYSQITWPEVRAGDVLMHENGDRLTVTEVGHDIVEASSGATFKGIWLRRGFTPYRRKPEMPTQPGAYMDKDGEFWLLRDDEGGIFSTPWFSDRTEVWVTPTYAARHAPFTRLVPMPTEGRVREAVKLATFTGVEAGVTAVMALLTGKEADDA